jgi:uncharacterized membrane protein
VLAVVLAWGAAHTVYTLKYARRCYTEPVGGFDSQWQGATGPHGLRRYRVGHRNGIRGGRHQPAHAEFRKTVLAQALLSFPFVTVILAVTINLVAGLKA